MSPTAITFEHPPIPGLFSIVIPVGWDAEGLEITLRSLAEMLPQGNSDTEILVANDGGDPAVAEVCAHYRVQHVPLVPNQGSYAARNAAMARARGEFICFLDADIRVTREWLPAIRRALAQAEYVAGAVEIDEAKVVSLGHRLDALNAFPVDLYLAEVGFGPTANLAVHRRVIEALGGFDARLRSGGDVEFGRRVRDAGLCQVYAADAVVLHPPRDFRQQLRKIQRTVTGVKMLHHLFPDRFLPPAQVYRGRVRLLLPPRGVVKRRKPPEPLKWQETVRLYFMCWLLKLTRFYWLHHPRERYDCGQPVTRTVLRGGASHPAPVIDGRK